ncbi:MAG: ATP-binding cassette domain-containing protein [Gemmatimonas sp.]|nr:ATP-binding cassette domain-containing protein [Gemmatimonas sp.]
MSLSSAIATRSLGKCYGRVQAVHDLDLEVRRGEIYALLGRNGAGKTTTIRMLLGLVRPSTGEVEILGRRIGPLETEGFRRMGSLVETATAYPNLTVRENLELHRRLTGTPSGVVVKWIDRLRLDPFAHRRADQLSLGNLQRLALARALLHDPEVLVLDEPANALDPAGIVEIRELLRELSAQHGVTVFLSSHSLGEVSRLADRVGIVHEGRLLEELDPSLRADEQRYVEVRVSDPDRASTVLQKSGMRQVTRQDGRLRVYDSAGREAEIARVIVQAGIDLTSLTPIEDDLEDYFLKRTGGLS